MIFLLAFTCLCAVLVAASSSLKVVVSAAAMQSVCLAVILAALGSYLVSGLYFALYGIALPALIFLLDQEQLRKSAGQKEIKSNCGRYAWVATVFATLACALCIWLVLGDKEVGTELLQSLLVGSFVLFFAGLIGLVRHSYTISLVAVGQVLTSSVVLLLVVAASKAADQPSFVAAILVCIASFLLLVMGALLDRLLFLKLQVRSADELRLLRG